MLFTQQLHLFFYTTLALVIVGLTAVILIKARNYLSSKNQLVFQLNEHIEELETLNSRISNQHNILEQYKHNVTESLNYTSRLQRAILPNDAVFNNSSFKHFVLYKPRDIVSGDFYFIKNVKNKLIIALGDCTGHGIPGASLSMMGHALLNEIVATPGIQNVNQILNLLNSKVMNLFQGGKDSLEYQDGMDIAICSIDKFTNKLQFAGAKMNFFLIKKASTREGNGEIIKIEGDKISIGNLPFENNTEFRCNEIQLEPGDTFYLSSDGFTSQFGGKKNKKFNTSRFIKALQNLQEYDIEEQKEILNQTFINWQGENEQIDDVLVVGVRLRNQKEILKGIEKVLIEWDKNIYSIGSELIDNQHEQLVLYINRLYNAYLIHTDSLILDDIFYQLKLYIKFHFQTEERALKKQMNEKIERHISEHHFFIEKINSLSKEYYSGNKNITFEIIVFLKDWLINHIVKTDFKCKHILNNAIVYELEESVF